ncbi:hypothetical protein [Jannaschia pohangensis]|nr:hypothetical protein [Jannaschia pohangensis]
MAIMCRHVLTRAAVAAVLLATPAMAEVCVLPVEGSGAVLDALLREREVRAGPEGNTRRLWADRIADSPRAQFDFPHLIVWAAGPAKGHYAIDGHSFRKIEAYFPDGPLARFPWEAWAAPDGTRYRRGHDAGGLVYQLLPGASAWAAIPLTDRTVWPLFDTGNGDFYFGRPGLQMASRVVDGQRVATDPLPGDRDTGEWTNSIRTVPGLGTFALSSAYLWGTFGQRAPRTLWFRSPDGDWRVVPVDLPEGESLLTDLNAATFDRDGEILRWFPGPTEASTVPPLFLRLTGAGPVFAGSAPPGRYRFDAASGAWMGWDFTGLQYIPSRWKVALGLARDPVTPRFRVVRRGDVAAVAIDGILARTMTTDTSVLHTTGPVILQPSRPALIWTDIGFAAFDGETTVFPPDLSTNRIGSHVQVYQVGERTVILGTEGSFLLNADMTADRVTEYPVSGRAIAWSRHHPIPGSDLHVLVGDGNRPFHVTSDFRTYRQVETSAPLLDHVAALPDRAAVLLTGEDGLYSLEAECPQDR